MAAIAVNVRRKQAGSPTLDLEGDLQRARWLANLLDAEFSLGGIKFGLDAIVGLVPVVGDTVSFVAGMYPIFWPASTSWARRSSGGCGATSWWTTSAEWSRSWA